MKNEDKPAPWLHPHGVAMLKVIPAKLRIPCQLRTFRGPLLWPRATVVPFLGGCDGDGVGVSLPFPQLRLQDFGDADLLRSRWKRWQGRDPLVALCKKGRANTFAPATTLQPAI